MEVSHTMMASHDVKKIADMGAITVVDSCKNNHYMCNHGPYGDCFHVKN